MAGFFLIGEGEGREETSSQEYRHGHHQETTSTHNWFMYKNHVSQELPTYKGFELWQQQQQTDPIINPFGLNIGPSHENHHHEPNNNSRCATNFMMMMRSSRSNSNSSTISCQDCGNQAKKDCQHMRCRTCCKNRGFQCQTHVKSTWVPAAKRRERQHQQQQQEEQEEDDDNKPKRQKDDSIITTHLPSNNNTGLELGNFPSKVNSTAVFQRVRMSSIEDCEDQIAYQAVVNIGGHIFKGILYDQKEDNNYMMNNNNNGGGDSSSGGGGGGGDPAPHHQHNLIVGTATSAANNNTAIGCGGAPAAAVSVAEGSNFLEPSIYNNTFMAGTQFFPPPRFRDY